MSWSTSELRVADRCKAVLHVSCLSLIVILSVHCSLVILLGKGWTFALLFSCIFVSFQSGVLGLWYLTVWFLIFVFLSISICKMNYMNWYYRYLKWPTLHYATLYVVRGCSNMNASSFKTFFTYMLRQNVIPFWKELFVAFKMATNIKKHSLYFSSYRRLYKFHFCILKFFWSNLPYTFWYMCGYSVISFLVCGKMAQNLRCNFKVHWQSCLQNKVYIILFQSRENRHVYDVINFMINVILSYLLMMQ